MMTALQHAGKIRRWKEWKHRSHAAVAESQKPGKVQGVGGSVGETLFCGGTRK